MVVIVEIKILALTSLRLEQKQIKQSGTFLRVI